MQHTSSAHAAEPRFPFSANVAQERMKRALLLNAVNPRIGGALIRGNKGTAKSTAVRALAGVLPSIHVVQGCPYSCDLGDERAACLHCSQTDQPAVALQRSVRIVELPVGASEDRLIGALDIERALATGEQAFEPGILAAAHRGILYVDEVNLLTDHLVDVLLDAAAMGRNFVERDGLSISHPAGFILVGTMNPEEGELRPQLLDRFGLMVEADAEFSTAEQIEVVKRRIAFESDPSAFIESWSEQDRQLRRRILAAQAGLSRVAVPDSMREAIAHVCSEHGVDGLRADIVIHRTASTIAAWQEREEVAIADVAEAARLALAHRLRRMPFEQPTLDSEHLDDMLAAFEDGRNESEPGTPPQSEAFTETEANAEPARPPEAEPSPENEHVDGPPQADQHVAIGAPVPIQPPAAPPRDARPRNASGRRATTLSEERTGRQIGVRRPEGAIADLDVAATVLAAAPRQHDRGAATFEIRASDVRVKQREAKASALVVFVLDASGSMGARRRMEATKGAVFSLLMDAYQSRDRVALITVRGAGATLALPPTRSVELAHCRLAELPTGGRTPLWAGIDRAAELVIAEQETSANLIPLLVLVSDGRANASRGSIGPSEATIESAHRFRSLGVRSLVIDAEEGYVRLGMAKRLAHELSAEYVALDQLDETSLAKSVRRATRQQT